MEPLSWILLQIWYEHAVPIKWISFCERQSFVFPQEDRNASQPCLSLFVGSSVCPVCFMSPMSPLDKRAFCTEGYKHSLRGNKCKLGVPPCSFSCCLWPLPYLDYHWSRYALASAVSFLRLVLTCSDRELPAKMGWVMSHLLPCRLGPWGRLVLLRRTLASKQQTPLLSTWVLCATGLALV